MSNQVQSQSPQRPIVEGPGGNQPVVDPAPRATYSYRATAVVWLIGGVVSALIAVRFILELLGASTAAAFTSFVYSITDPLVAPFFGIFPIRVRHGFVFDTAALLAVVIYLLATWGVVALTRIASTSRGARTPVD